MDGLKKLQFSSIEEAGYSLHGESNKNFLKKHACLFIPCQGVVNCLADGQHFG